MAPNRRWDIGLVRTAIAIAILLFATACSQLSRATGLSSPIGNPVPATAIALTIPTDAIYLVDPVSGRAIPIVTDLVGLQAGYASWSTGHTALAYGDAGVRIFDPSKQTSTLVIGGSTISMPSFSPRGTSVVFGDGAHMGVLPLAAAEPLPVPGPVPSLAQLPLPNTLAPYAFDWAGSKRIVFQGVLLDCSGPEGCLATPTSDIWTIRPDGTDLLQVTTSGDAGSPKWAPGGHRFLYVRATERRGFGSQLWVAKADGSSPHALIAARNVVAAAWSQDGTELVVIRLDVATSSLQIWVGNEDGSNLHQVGVSLPGTTATVDW